MGYLCSESGVRYIRAVGSELVVHVAISNMNTVGIHHTVNLERAIPVLLI